MLAPSIGPTVWKTAAGSFDGVENPSVDSIAMTAGADASASLPAQEEPAPPRRRLRLRLPASRGRLGVLVVLCVLAAFLAFQVGRQVYASWSISRQASDLQQQLDDLARQNAALRDQLAYARSSAYIDEQARRLANLGRPGEQILIIPRGAVAPLPPGLRAATPAAKPLLEQWLELFFGP